MKCPNCGVELKYVDWYRFFMESWELYADEKKLISVQLLDNKFVCPHCNHTILIGGEDSLKEMIRKLKSSGGLHERET
jgi:predicted RNA-binding Zn-ribbon protein involved in translation (DUF1610 family)